MTSCFATDPDKTSSKVSSIMYHSTSMGALALCISRNSFDRHWGMLNGSTFCFVSCIFSISCHLVGRVTLHPLTFVPVSTKTLPRRLFRMTYSLKSLRVFVVVLLTLILRRSILKMSAP